MKKFGIIALAALLVFAFTMPAAAVENIFGGYMRVRAWTQNNFTGEDTTEAMDLSIVDQRTRLYYTAKFSDNFKFVNKFEFDMDWGKDGDFGVDFKGMEIKNSYVDFNLSNWNLKLGAQGATIARGFIFADDFAGAVVTYKGEGFSLPFYWLRAYEGGYDVDDANDADFDFFGITPKFNVGDDATIQPILVAVKSKQSGTFNPIIQGYTGDPSTSYGALSLGADAEDLNIYFLGVNADFKLGGASLWGTFIYESGDIEYVTSTDDFDIDAFLFAFGGSTSVGGTGIHGQVFYATGHDFTSTSDDYEAFWVPTNSLWKGQSYYWAEIMGYGTFDDDFSMGSPAGDKISNIGALNVGVSFKATENTKVTADLWYAQLAEDDILGNKDLGFEIDLKATIKLMDNLNLDIVGAYLFAGDATNILSELAPSLIDDADPYLLGTRLSLSF